MQQQAATAMSRIDARIPLSVRETIDRAAAMQGRSRTDFLIMAALEKAEKVIMEQNIVRLALEDQMTLARAMHEQHIAPPSPEIDALRKEYAKRVASE